MNWLLLLALFFFINVHVRAQDPILRKRHLQSRNGCGQLLVEILISPLVNKSEVRPIELQWEFAPAQPGDWIALFRKDPLRANRMPPVLWSTPITQQHGWLKTDIFEEHIDAEFLGYSARCLDYFAAYMDGSNRTLTATCLRTEPTWMWDIRPEIGDKRIRDVFIPGTHDSAAYREYREDKGDTIVSKYTFTQDESILAQLISGIRYIDLRVGHYPSNREEFWGNHGPSKIHPLRIICRDIRHFLEHTKEIVILDVQEFPIGFTKSTSFEIHKRLEAFLAVELGGYVTSPVLGYDSTLNDIWKTGKRLIIGYDDRRTVAESSYLWPPVAQKWGDVKDLPSLYRYLAGVLERPPSTAWSAMAQLTPSTMDVLLDRFKGLRVAAEKVNHNVTEWYHHPDWAHRSNVVAVDYFRGSGIVRAAITWNKFHGRCS